MIRAAASRVWKCCTATPKRQVVTLAVIASVVGLTIVTALWFGPAWTLYSLDGTGLVVELPQPPEAARAGLGGSAGVLFQMRCPEMAMVASGGTVPTDSQPDPEFMVRQARSDLLLISRTIASGGDATSLACHSALRSIGDCCSLTPCASRFTDRRSFMPGL